MDEELKEEDGNAALLHFVECYGGAMRAIIKPR